uniref:BZIP domain-containing protein n=1 Tax=Cryptomonas curvata TaxID=233186 RepID=A0A7S0QZS7_9CRYP|mmetsp:Transcript_6430/g.14135  ORF Transcript_6430/g.14135 Transcript_6430/m.14135 type:complete len:194 (+) Transcript_6430:28-609(+)
MDHQQAGFEELIASSLACLDQVHRNHNTEDNCCRNEIHSNLFFPLQKSSWNIDDFLAHYTPQHSSIRDFLLGFEEHIACSDDSDRVLSMEIGSPGEHIDPSAPIDFDASLSFTESKTSTPVLNLQLERGEETSPILQVVEKADRSKRNPVPSKRGRPKLTVEDREERRRSQNREAQRRFREKHMTQTNRGDAS